jgi:hypothetical protein
MGRGEIRNPEEKRVMQGRMRALHKMCNGWLKNWGILFQVFHITSLCMGMFSGHDAQW